MQKRAQRDGDPVGLRLSIAREEAAAFSVARRGNDRRRAGKRQGPNASRDHRRACEPHALGRVRGSRRPQHPEGRSRNRPKLRPLGWRQGAEGGRGGVAPRRAATFPGQFANAFERAGGLARKGGDGLKRHYEFVLEAQELRARYAELLARAPILTEKGKQFLARLELEKRAEQFRESSGDAADWARQKVVVAIAYLIRGLQYVQAKITPQQNKQLAVLASAEEPARAPAEAGASG